MDEVNNLPTEGCQRQGCVNKGSLDPKDYILAGYSAANDGTKYRRFTCRGCKRSVTNKVPRTYTDLQYGCPHEGCENHGKLDGVLYYRAGRRYICKSCRKYFTGIERSVLPDLKRGCPKDGCVNNGVLDGKEYVRYGTIRDGSRRQKYRCNSCRATFVDELTVKLPKPVKPPKPPKPPKPVKPPKPPKPPKPVKPVFIPPPERLLMAQNMLMQHELEERLARQLDRIEAGRGNKTRVVGTL